MRFFKKKLSIEIRTNNRSSDKYLEVLAERIDGRWIMKRMGTVGNPDGCPLEDALKSALEHVIHHHNYLTTTVLNAPNMETNYILSIRLEERKNVRYCK